MNLTRPGMRARVLRCTKTLANKMVGFVCQARRKPQRYPRYREDLQRRMASEGGRLMAMFWWNGALKCCAALAITCALATGEAHAERLKDLASIQGVRENQLIGYSLVVGLDGKGDQTTQTPFTVQSIASMLQNLGVNLPATAVANLQLTNVAAVMVTAALPAFARTGQFLDVTVSSIGNAKSLRGGTLLMTPMKGADGKIYAMAQGSVVVASPGGAPAGGKAQIPQLSVGRIPAGATVEREVPSPLGQGDAIYLELNETDFSTVAKIVGAVNRRFGADSAIAVDGRAVRVRAPLSSDERIAFLGELLDIDVSPGKLAAKVILNARTGSIVMNQAVTIDTCAVSHGNLSVVVNAESAAAPAPAAETAAAAAAAATAPQPPAEAKMGQVLLVRSGASLNEVVKALNAIGVSPQDLLAILQAMKAAGALRAELEII